MMRAEASAAESPLVQRLRSPGLPARSHETKDGHQQKEESENGSGRPIDHCRVHRVFR